jgi:nitrogen fixation protein FixH
MTTNGAVREFTGKHMLAIMLAFFGVVFAVNFTMVYFARHSWTGLVVENSYVASQEFNEKTAVMEADAALDVHPRLSVDQGILKLTLLTKAGEPVTASSVKVSLGRPSDDGEDFTVGLTEKAPGHFEVAHDLALGVWTGTVSADLPGHGAWSRPLRIVLK